MNRREGMKSFCFCFSCSYSNAAPIAFAVQLPSCPWSYTGGIFEVRFTFLGRATRTFSGAEYMKSRASGRSGTQPKRCTVRVRSLPFTELVLTSSSLLNWVAGCRSDHSDREGVRRDRRCIAFPRATLNQAETRRPDRLAGHRHEFVPTGGSF